MYSFILTFLSIFKLFLVALTGYIIYKWKIVDSPRTLEVRGKPRTCTQRPVLPEVLGKTRGSQFLDGLSILLIDIIVPCLILSTFLEKFDWQDIEQKFLAVLTAPALILLSFLLGFSWSKMFKFGSEKLRPFIAMNMFQNSVYLPVAILSAVAKPHELPTALTFVFLYQLVHSPLLWSVGVKMLQENDLTRKTSELSSSRHSLVKIPLFSPFIKVGLRGISSEVSSNVRREPRFLPGLPLFSTPFYATLLGIIFALPPIKNVIPNFLVDVLKLAGSVTIPLSLLFLGAVIADFMSTPNDISFHELLGNPRTPGKGALRFVFSDFSLGLVIVKMILLPLCVLLIVILFRLPKLFALFLIVESACPPAVNLSVISQKYQSNKELVCSGIILTYIVSLFIIPILVFLWNVVYTCGI